MDRDLLNIVLVLPPAPAALVLLGLAFATLSALSAAALRLIAVAGPPGALAPRLSRSDFALAPVAMAVESWISPGGGEGDGEGEDYRKS